MKTPPPVADFLYEAASRARNQSWGYHETLDREHFERVVRDGMSDPALRVVVETIWFMATAPHRRKIATLRSQVADEIRAKICPGATMPEDVGDVYDAASVGEWAALIAEGKL